MLEHDLDLPNWTAVRNSCSSLSFVRAEGIAFENQRLTTEILLSFDKENMLNLQVKSRGFILPLGNLGITKEIEELPTLSKVRLLAHFLDSSTYSSQMTISKPTNR